MVWILCATSTGLACHALLVLCIVLVEARNLQSSSRLLLAPLTPLELSVPSGPTPRQVSEAVYRGLDVKLPKGPTRRRLSLQSLGSLIQEENPDLKLATLGQWQSCNSISVSDCCSLPNQSMLLSREDQCRCVEADGVTLKQSVVNRICSLRWGLCAEITSESCCATTPKTILEEYGFLGGPALSKHCACAKAEDVNMGQAGIDERCSLEHLQHGKIKERPWQNCKEVLLSDCCKLSPKALRMNDGNGKCRCADAGHDGSTQERIEDFCQLAWGPCQIQTQAKCCSKNPPAAWVDYGNTSASNFSRQCACASAGFVNSTQKELDLNCRGRAEAEAEAEGFKSHVPVQSNDTAVMQLKKVKSSNGTHSSVKVYDASGKPEKRKGTAAGKSSPAQEVKGKLMVMASRGAEVPTCRGQVRTLHSQTLSQLRTLEGSEPRFTQKNGSELIASATDEDCNADAGSATTFSLQTLKGGNYLLRLQANHNSPLQHPKIQVLIDKDTVSVPVTEVSRDRKTWQWINLHFQAVQAVTSIQLETDASSCTNIGKIQYALCKQALMRSSLPDAVSFERETQPFSLKSTNRDNAGTVIQEKTEESRSTSSWQTLKTEVQEQVLSWKAALMAYLAILILACVTWSLMHPSDEAQVAKVETSAAVSRSARVLHEKPVKDLSRWSQPRLATARAAESSPSRKAVKSSVRIARKNSPKPFSTRLQALWRGYKVRKLVASYKVHSLEREKASVRIQALVRGWKARTRIAGRPARQEVARLLQDKQRICLSFQGLSVWNLHDQLSYSLELSCQAAADTQSSLKCVEKTEEKESQGNVEFSDQLDLRRVSQEHVLHISLCGDDAILGRASLEVERISRHFPTFNLRDEPDSVTLEVRLRNEWHAAAKAKLNVVCFEALRFSFHILSASGLPKVDMLGNRDAYVELRVTRDVSCSKFLRHADKDCIWSGRTQAAADTLNPEWNKVIRCILPGDPSLKLQVVLWDSRAPLADTPLGHHVLELKEAICKQQGLPPVRQKLKFMRLPGHAKELGISATTLTMAITSNLLFSQ